MVSRPRCGTGGILRGEDKMKRSISTVLGLLILLSPLFVFAAATAVIGTVEKVVIDGKVQRIVIPITFTAHTDASETTFSLNPDTYKIKGWYLYKVQTDPGATGPTNGAWDFDITDAKGEVLSRNLVDDRSSTATQTVYFTSGYPQILDTWTLSIGDNAVNSAVVVVYLTFVMN